MKQVFFITIILSCFAVMSCGRSQTPTAEVNVAQVKEVTLDPNDSSWNDISLHVSKMLLQDLVDPRLMEPSTGEVQVKAITDGQQIAFRLEWMDETQNDLPGPKHFIDGCAVQLPAKIDPNVPAPQMGEVGKTVEIAFWRADWQAIVEGRADNIQSIYPNATVDHYPSEAKPLENNPQALSEAAARYAPARALGNRRAGPRDQPVEDMIAEGPGTLSPAPNAVSKGKGVRTKTGWAVVISRPVPAGFSPAAPSQIAFAVWEAAHGEVGSAQDAYGLGSDDLKVRVKDMNSAEELLRDAAEWRMISLLFDCPRGDWFKQVDELADQVTDMKLKQAAVAVRHEASEGLFHSIFGPGGPAPGREVSYRSWVEPGQLLSELSAYYSAFSYHAGSGEVPDHIAVETGFIAYLRLKELYARENGDDESAEITADAASRFMSDHITKYAQKVNKLFSASGIEYLRLAAEALFERVGPDKDKELKTFLPVLEEEDEALFECGAASLA